MRTRPASILFIFALVSVVALSMTPRGLALCIGGGHELGEALAGWCREFGGHVHGPSASHEDECGHSHSHSHAHTHAHRDGAPPCEHNHDPHPEPCSDIRLGLDDCRPQVVSWSIDSGHHQLALPIAQWPVLSLFALPVHESACRQRWKSEHFAGPPRAQQSSLRAVVLLI